MAGSGASFLKEHRSNSVLSGLLEPSRTRLFCCVHFSWCGDCGMGAGPHQGKQKSSRARNGNHAMLPCGSGNPLKAVSRFPSKSILTAAAPGCDSWCMTKGRHKAQCVPPLLMGSKPLWVQQVFGADRGNILSLFIPLSQEETPICHQLEWVADLAEQSQMKPARGAACRACAACRERALTSGHLFLCPLMWIWMRVSGIAVSYWAGVLREASWCWRILLSFFPPLKGVSGVSALLIGVDFYLFF